MKKIVALVFVFIAIWGCKPANEDRNKDSEEITEEVSKNMEIENASSSKPIAEEVEDESTPAEVEPLPETTLEKETSSEVPLCIAELIEQGVIKNVYSYTFGEDELVYLVEKNTDKDGSSTLYDSDCGEICRYNASDNVWTYPCASFPRRSDNEKLLYPLEN